MKSKWLTWKPGGVAEEKAAGLEATKPTIPSSEGFVGTHPRDFTLEKAIAKESWSQVTKGAPSATRTPFVHLHVHTDYSLLDGACSVKSLVEETARQGMPAVAVTDHGNLFAAQAFCSEAEIRGIKPIVGCEMYVSNGSRFDRSAAAQRGKGRSNHAPNTSGAGKLGHRGTNHLVLLSETAEGYQNLIKLSSAGFLEGFYYKPRVDHDLLAKHSRGLIALSGCLSGEINEFLLADEYNQARQSACRLRDIFGEGNFFLEMQDHGLDAQKRINREIIRLSKETGIPYVATNDCHYIRQADARAHDALLCIQSGKSMSDTKRMRFETDQFYFKTAEEMAQVFAELPDALTRTVAISERCDLRIPRVVHPFPEFKVPEGYTLNSYFERTVRGGFAERIPDLEARVKEGRLRRPLAEYESRLTEEIRLIEQMHFAGYFLIVWDFIRHARARGIPVGPGRGSAPGSLVSYALRITQVDPIENGLFFERFLNPERVSMPDIDIDFCMRRRGEVIEYVTERYRRANVAQIITFGTMAAKAAIKDVGRAMGLPYGEVDRIAKYVPAQLNITLDEALKQAPELKSLIESDARYKDVMDVAKRLEGLARHASTHAAGVVISPEPLTNFVPLYKSNRNEITTQYDMKGLERLGLLKMDFLGLKTLTVLTDAVKLVAANRGVAIDLDTLPTDDMRTFQLFARGDTSGVFQFESDGMRDILRRYKPSRLEDLTALNALYRPGPIQGGMIDDFIARKYDKRKVQYDLPELREILEETHGVMLYQEQAMQIANRLAGFSLGQADVLRHAIGKKNRDEMGAQREKFLAGCATNKIPTKKAEHIFGLITKFAEYGFNKSHSCAYALLAYQTAWLKVNFPVEFMAALLTSETGNTDKVVKYIQEARSMGIEALPPDVNSSNLHFTPMGPAIRFGLSVIKNVGEGAANAVIEARSRLGGFKTLSELSNNVAPRLLGKRALESMIKAGAMDSLGLSRAQLAVNLFGTGKLSATTDWSPAQRLTGEKEALGLYLSGHPLNLHEGRLRTITTYKTSSLLKVAHGTSVTLAGELTEFKEARSKKGNLWAKGILEDRSGRVDLIVFASALEKFREILTPGGVVIIKGQLQRESGDRLKVFVNEVENLST